MAKPKFNDLVTIFLAFLDSTRSDLTSNLPDSCSFIHIKALEVVSKNGEPSMRDIAKELNITSPGTTMVVEKLVENGEIERVNDPNDRRIIRLRLTKKGKLTHRRGMQEIKKRINNKLSRLSPEEQIRLSNILGKLTVKN